MSVFIAGFCIANLIFGHAAKTKPPFRLVAIGTFVWIIAIFLSGLSKSLESFYLLLFARALSGVGEAAIQTVVPAFIDSQISSKRRSSALAIFYLGFPVGGALGFLWGSYAASSIGWVCCSFSDSLVVLKKKQHVSLTGLGILPGDSVHTSITFDMSHLTVRSTDRIRCTESICTSSLISK